MRADTDSRGVRELAFSTAKDGVNWVLSLRGRTENVLSFYGIYICVQF